MNYMERPIQQYNQVRTSMVSLKPLRVPKKRAFTNELVTLKKTANGPFSFTNTSIVCYGKY